MKIIVAMEKFCDLNPSLGVTSANSNVVGSLQCTNHEFQVFYYDEYLSQNNRHIDEFLTEKVNAEKPDLLFVSYYPVDNDSRNIKLETVQKIRDNGTKVVFIWFDYGHPHIEQLALKCSDYNSLNVVVDVYQEQSDKSLSMWVPQDERIFCYQDEKLNGVCFVGTKNAYDERRTYLDFLKNKVNINLSGGQREHRLTIEQYAQKLKDSKISLNFPSKPDGTIQAKCRIYESLLCGCLLLERENEAIKKWFVPDEDYVPFTDQNDLLRKIRFYLNNPTERLRTAANGHSKMTKNYSSQNWWDTVSKAVN